VAITGASAWRGWELSEHMGQLGARAHVRNDSVSELRFGTSVGREEDIVDIRTYDECL
jgi:NAD(P)-dependent dehydrogenase (short-subunit alcohol dehydrogenase family)